MGQSIYLHFTFIRRFYPKRLTIAFRLYIFVSTCVPWESNPQPFALLSQCSTTGPHRNTGIHTNWFFVSNPCELPEHTEWKIGGLIQKVRKYNILIRYGNPIMHCNGIEEKNGEYNREMLIKNIYLLIIASIAEKYTYNLNLIKSKYFNLYM